MTLPLIKVFPYMKFYFHRIGRTGVSSGNQSRQNVLTGNNSKNIDARILDFLYKIIFLALKKFHSNSINRPDFFWKPKCIRTCEKRNNSRNIDVTVMELLNDTLSHQGISIYEMSFE